MSWYSNLTLAQTTDAPVGPGAVQEGAPPGGQSTTGEPGDAQTPQERPPLFFDPWFMLIIFLVIFWFLILMPQKREKKKHAALMANLKKGDRVQTIGGILATVVEVRDHEVILKVDENTNTRMRFTRAAIQGVLGNGGDKE
jgi:preprotein translocase subunit YajC